MTFHMYADDTHLYIPVELRNPTAQDAAIKTIEVCTRAIQKWMSENCLKLNGDKTEVLALFPPSLKGYRPSSANVCGASVDICHSVRNLGVIFDETLCMKENIGNICKRAYYQIHLISKIRDTITEDAARKLMKDNVLSHLDYCNSLLVGLPESAINRLQRVQNCAARVIMKANRRSHITPVLKQLHWLPIKYRILYKINLITFHALNFQCPFYIFDLLQNYQPTRALRSCNQNLLCVPNFRLQTYGARSFSVKAPQLWNSLPTEIRQINSLTLFKSKLKTFYFKLAFNC